MLLVRGPIAREYQPSLQIRRFQSASLEGGYRIHLHRREDLRPLELDPGNFEFGFTLTGSSLLELLGWLEVVARGVPARRHVPAHHAGVGTRRGADLGGHGGHRRPAPGPPRSGFGKDEAPAVLDNVAQFRFHSGWRAAVERRR